MPSTMKDERERGQLSTRRGLRRERERGWDWERSKCGHDDVERLRAASLIGDGKGWRISGYVLGLQVGPHMG